ncbi:MAG: hypothetical protein GZ091_16305 [Paludibacter sp.]|nr:hypothetical protein [Paludibacter sp.]
MQKVIVITSNGMIGSNDKFLETEYPTLSQALKEGYKVTQVIPVVKPATTNTYYETIFILDNLR